MCTFSKSLLMIYSWTETCWSRPHCLVLSLPQSADIAYTLLLTSALLVGRLRRSNLNMHVWGSAGTFVFFNIIICSFDRVLSICLANFLISYILVFKVQFISTKEWAGTAWNYIQTEGNAKLLGVTLIGSKRFWSFVLCYRLLLQGGKVPGRLSSFMMLLLRRTTVFRTRPILWWQEAWNKSLASLHAHNEPVIFSWKLCLGWHVLVVATLMRYSATVTTLL